MTFFFYFSHISLLLFGVYVFYIYIFFSQRYTGIFFLSCVGIFCKGNIYKAII